MRQTLESYSDESLADHRREDTASDLCEHVLHVTWSSPSWTGWDTRSHDTTADIER